MRKLAVFSLIVMMSAPALANPPIAPNSDTAGAEVNLDATPDSYLGDGLTEDMASDMAIDTQDSADLSSESELNLLHDPRNPHLPLMRWTCIAADRNGHRFGATSFTPSEARRRAFHQCMSFHRYPRPYFHGCRIIRCFRR